MYVFGFIVAATLGCTAGSVDLTEGMFRHLVVTGRSRLALYLARIPAGLAIVVPMVAIGFTIVCAVCVFAAPTTLNYDGVNVPAGLSLTGFESWAADHSDVVVCNFPTTDRVCRTSRCGPNGPVGSPRPSALRVRAAHASSAQSGRPYRSPARTTALLDRASCTRPTR